MPTRNGTDTFTARIALSDNRCLHLWRPLAPLARAREHLEPLRALAHRSITRDYHSSSALQPNQGAETRRYASHAQGGGRTALTHILTDTCGFLIFILVHTADVLDRDGAVDVLKSVRRRFPWLRHVFADGGYAGDKLRHALRRIGKWTVKIVKRSDTAKGFVVLPRRWVVERTLAWLNRNRRLAKDFEQTIASATAWLFIASIQLFTRRIARL